MTPALRSGVAPWECLCLNNYSMLYFFFSFLLQKGHHMTF